MRNRGEQIAEKYLRGLGYRILERNFRVHMVGEVDLVCMDGDEVVFVEVRERNSFNFGEPEDSISFKKLSKIIKTAEIYLQNNRVEADWRVDVIAICNGRVEHLKGVV